MSDSKNQQRGFAATQKCTLPSAGMVYNNDSSKERAHPLWKKILPTHTHRVADWYAIKDLGFRHRENVNFVGRCQQITATCMLAQSMHTWIQKTIYKFRWLIK